MKTSRKNSKKQSQKLKKHAKRLAAYSAAAAVTVLATNQLANATEVVYDIPDVNMFDGDQGKWIQIGGDPNAAFAPGATSNVGYAFYYGTLGRFRVNPENAGYIYGPTYLTVYSVADPNIVVPPIVGFAGQVAGDVWASYYTPSSTIWGDHPTDPNQEASFAANSGAYYAHFADIDMYSGHGVIGIRFGLPDDADPNVVNTHYGWAQIYKYSDTAFTLTGFGYNDDHTQAFTHPTDTYQLIADMDGDLDADADDWDIFKAAWGSVTDPNHRADTNKDFKVDLVDYENFVQSFNLEQGPGALAAVIAAAAVPEPTTIMLLAAGAVGFGVWRKRKAV
jgi:hypothetical protein